MDYYVITEEKSSARKSSVNISIRQAKGRERKREIEEKLCTLLPSAFNEYGFWKFKPVKN